MCSAARIFSAVQMAAASTTTIVTTFALVTRAGKVQLAPCRSVVGAMSVRMALPAQTNAAFVKLVSTVTIVLSMTLAG